MASRRGGGSAPAHCKTQLRRCMVSDVRSGGSLRAIARTCMDSFNTCRSKGKSKKRRSSKSGKGRCLNWSKGRTRCLKRAKR